MMIVFVDIIIYSLFFRVGWVGMGRTSLDNSRVTNGKPPSK
jgi:hypothetical protein